MTEMEDKRVEDFLLKYKAEIPDQGFTRRVMRHLPQRMSLLQRLMWLAFGVLFVVMDGLRALAHDVLKALTTLGVECVESFSWTTVGMGFGLLVLAVWYYGFYAEE
jgi:hypothetical protein